MDAVEFLKERQRMCESNYDRETECKCCIAHDSLGDRHKCKALMLHDIKIKTETDFMIAVSIVEKWSKDHPRKTRLQDFLEKYPNALLTPNGNKIPKSCAQNLGYCESCPVGGNCYSCWNEPVED